MGFYRTAFARVFFGVSNTLSAFVWRVSRAANATAFLVKRYANARLSLICVLYLLTITANTAIAVEVPIAWCSAGAGNCNNTPPTYGGPTPAEWEGAAELAAIRYAAAHYLSGGCPCDGRVCSSLLSPTSWSLVTAVLTGYVDAPWTSGSTSLDAIENIQNGQPWGTSYGYGTWSMPTCGCPDGAGFDSRGVCVCQTNRIWNGSSCIIPASFTNGFTQYLDTYSPAQIPAKNQGQCGVGNPITPGLGIKVLAPIEF